jgi:hypothetical protein
MRLLAAARVEAILSHGAEVILPGSNERFP